MILRLKYDELKADAVKGKVNGKAFSFFLRLVVDRSNLSEAIRRFTDNKLLLAFDYQDDPAALQGVDLGVKPVLYTQQVETLDINIDMLLNQLPAKMHLVCQLPSTFNDMRAIADYSRKYHNIRFCGGNFLHLEGCRLGCILASEIPRKFSDSRLPITTTGCASLMPTVDLADVEEPQFVSSKVVVKDMISKPHTKPLSRNKQALASLIPLSRTTGLENF